MIPEALVSDKGRIEYHGIELIRLLARQKSVLS